MKIIARKPVQIAIIFYLGFIAFYFYNFNFNLSDDNGKWGTFGDFLGGALNPILGIITIVLTYDIIKGQEIENKQSEFKYLFQILFDVIDENKNLITFKRFDKTHHGRDALYIINKNIENLYKSLNEVEGSDENDNFEKAFWSVYDDINQSSSTFMKTVHNLLKIVDTYCVVERKSTYSDLVRAQFHSEELKFVLYNGIATGGFKNFKTRIEKFTILKDLEKDDSISESLKIRYKKSAFVEFNKKNNFKYDKEIFGYKINLKIIKIK
ncbi:putative phage abortive infection protein [Flavobacterium sp. MC2016-06]|jgi:hypothetical protein|uniref:putative phage abortive infection protein n=1 Tax=Flavobacterium sp. MC2016-06 TaxID=2676308 RepID=UPI0012BAB22C|nr:putative phage abortive infection protein [Flavobacterium sp. MC2016-06]MBU3861719.1 putative phage abortive infection protein [Flavobacterium sp. MC2016-06]